MPRFATRALALCHDLYFPFTDEQEAQAEIFRMRLEQFPEEDGMPEHFNPAWKSPGGENWSP